jgi:hypothetical protein
MISRRFGSESSGTIRPERGKCSSRSTDSSRRATTRSAYASESFGMNYQAASMSSTAWVVHRSLITRASVP